MDKTKKKDKTPESASVREPWIKKQNGLMVIAAASIVLAVLVGFQLIRGGTSWGEGILWGLIFGGSVWAVFYGMSWFHSLFNKKK